MTFTDYIPFSSSSEGEAGEEDRYRCGHTYVTDWCVFTTLFVFGSSQFDYHFWISDEFMTTKDQTCIYGLPPSWLGGRQ